MLFALFGGLPLVAQDRCGTVEYGQKLQQRRDVRETPEQFEQWLRARQARDGAANRPKAAPYQIPVVVHIIHNGEAVGSGTNLSVAQIQSQIATLNRDYQRENTDQTSTPSDFLPVAGSLDIEFVLAKQDPEGLATNGIVRVKGAKTQWSINDNYQLKSMSYWPSEDYLNLWVCNMTGYLGYAQFPVSSLPGLENSSDNASSDGVVIAYTAFGSTEDGAFPVLDPHYDKGRTATHEIGHFFGLRHIWGDDGSACGPPGDYVDDTPDQGGKTSTCPTHPAVDCPAIKKMFQNYMDYTYDECMNLFTKKQVDRMVTVLENSPRRVTLPTSHGLNMPVPVPNDAGIRAIVSPLAINCDNSVTPTIEIRNYGSNAVTSVTIRMDVTGGIVDTKVFTVSLPNATTTALLTFSDITLTPGSPADVTFTILNTNGGTDGNPANNAATLQASATATLAIPSSESFNTLPAGWTITDLDNFKPWTLVTAPNGFSATNKAMYMNFYDYEDGEGELDILTTPVIDLTNQEMAVLYFDVAYAPLSNGGGADGLKVYLLKDCNENIYEGTLIYSKAGSTLGTTTPTGASFVPSRSSDWRKEAVNLASFLGEEHVQLAFVGVNQYGNNLYLDNVQVLTSEYEDVSLVGITPDMITCEKAPRFQLTVRNSGTLPITSFTAHVQAGSRAAATTVITLDGPLVPGDSYTASLAPYTLSAGTNVIAFDLTSPNGEPDVNENDNHREMTLVVNDTRFTIPYRESFESGFSDWTLVSPTDGMLWKSKANLNMFGNSAYYNAFDNDTDGDEAWLISPVFDFTEATAASLQFYSSYAVNGTHKDRLRVLYSADCGNTFQAIPFFDKSGDGLAVKKSTTAWTPQELVDWQHRVIDLSVLAGRDDLRFAIVANNDQGNNIYIDNINFSTTTEANPLLNEQLYVIYQKPDGNDFYFTFNLPEKEPVQYEVIDAMGRRIVQASIPDVLNQTYPVSLGSAASEGVYIVRLGIGNRYYSTRLFIGR
jgi:hypothetical protein